MLRVPAAFPLLTILVTDLKTLEPTDWDALEPVIVSVWYNPSRSYPVTVKVIPLSFPELVIVTFASRSVELLSNPSSVKLPDKEVAFLLVKSPSESVPCFL